MSRSSLARALRQTTTPTRRLGTPEGGRRAAIAALFRVDADTGKERVLFIRRTQRPGDPWSGNVALPGGCGEPHETDEATAARETLEEVGVDVRDGSWRRLGRLCDDRAVAARGQLVLSMFGFESTSAKAPALTLSEDEVARAWWVDVERLDAGRVAWRSIPLEQCGLGRRLHPRLRDALRFFGVDSLNFASLRLPPPSSPGDDEPADDDRYSLWGLTLACFSDAIRRSQLKPPLVNGPSFTVFVPSLLTPLVDLYVSVAAFFAPARRQQQRDQHRGVVGKTKLISASFLILLGGGLSLPLLAPPSFPSSLIGGGLLAPQLR